MSVELKNDVALPPSPSRRGSRPKPRPALTFLTGGASTLPQSPLPPVESRSQFPLLDTNKTQAITFLKGVGGEHLPSRKLR